MILGQRGAWHETERGYFWMLLGMDLNLVAFLTVLLTEIDSKRVVSLTERAHVESSGSNHFERGKVSTHCFTLTL